MQCLKHKQSKLTKKEAKNRTGTEYNLSLMGGRGEKIKGKKKQKHTLREKKGSIIA